MTLEKAIEHLDAIYCTGQYDGAPDDDRAVKLGIEALKQLYANRHSAWPNRADILPGETEE